MLLGWYYQGFFDAKNKLYDRFMDQFSTLLYYHYEDRAEGLDFTPSPLCFLPYTK